MSVVIAIAGRDPMEVLEGHEGYGLVALTIEDLIEVGQVLVPDPLPEEPDHAVVVGRKTDGRMKTMAKASQWVINPLGMTTSPDDQSRVANPSY